MMVDSVKTLRVLFDNDQGNGYSSGCARVSWFDGPRSQPCPFGLAAITTKLLFHAFEENQLVCLSKTLVEATGNDGLTLEAGHHQIPFELELPQRPLVSSFTGKYGYVCYLVKAILQRPFHRDQHVCRELPIISHVDVNSPQLVCPISENSEKMVGFWIFASGPVSLNVNIERKGYCNGQSILIYAQIENCCSRLVLPKAVIYQIQTYMACGKIIRYKQVVASVRGSPIPSGCCATWNGKKLKIPLVSPSILNSDILRVEYSLAVIVQIPGAKKLKVELPVIIGTTPCNAFGNESLSMVSQFSPVMNWLALSLPDPPEAPPNYADIVSEVEREQHVSTVPCSQQASELIAGAMSRLSTVKHTSLGLVPAVFSELESGAAAQDKAKVYILLWSSVRSELSSSSWKRLNGASMSLKVGDED
ncbi:arrestin domain-containing protein 4 isoform X2 [Electrophorus electricus]|uniref:arrestin domain-containing protein 4 isoform X2 n=1 Tax=Electrophorus electricus TaxID=8005 RepID=UPI0015D04B54|nr:arrestin domain-containing protein 4 isoform X2 [Electrophorus electricus]